MTIVFIGGSRDIRLLPQDALPRLDSIMSRQFHVIIGDAPGADTLLQRQLHYLRYPHVTVFCSGSACRNNVGNWPVQQVPVPRHVAFGFQFYAAKDRAMAQHADYGLLLWDGKSPGTLLNTMRLTEAGKKSRLINTSTGETLSFNTREDWQSFYAACPPLLRNRITERTIPKDLDRDSDGPEREVFKTRIKSEQSKFPTR